jgi:hypothetical protein
VSASFGDQATDLHIDGLPSTGQPESIIWSYALDPKPQGGDPAALPEPASWGLLGVAFTGLWVGRRRSLHQTA